MRIGEPVRLQLQVPQAGGKGGPATSGTLESLPDGSRVSGRLEGEGRTLRFLHEGRSYPVRLENPQALPPGGRHIIATVHREGGKVFLQPQAGGLLPPGSDVPAGALPLVSRAAAVLRALGFPVEREMVQRLVAGVSRLAPGDPQLFSLLLMEAGAERASLGRLAGRLLAALRRRGGRAGNEALRQLVDQLGKPEVAEAGTGGTSRTSPVGLAWFPAAATDGQPLPALVAHEAPEAGGCRLFSELELSRLGLVRIMMRVAPPAPPETTLFCGQAVLAELEAAFADRPEVRVLVRHGEDFLLEWPLAYLAEYGARRYEAQA